MSHAVRRGGLLLLGGLSLVGGMAAGLARLGLPTAPGPFAAAEHGALMIGGFLGTLIGLERAVALGRRWAYAAPVLSGVAGVALLGGAPRVVYAPLAGLGSVVFVMAALGVVGRQRSLDTITMAIGAACWAVGNAHWIAGRPVGSFVLWWIGFPVLTIAGERLQLSRLVAPGRAARAAFAGTVVLFLLGVAGTPVWPALGARLAGAGLLALVAWLARWDVARRILFRPGPPGYVAAAVLSGSLWLAVGGVLLVTRPWMTAGPAYDALVHALVLGFAFAMIFGHAPTILPAVLRVALPYRHELWIPLVLLHVTVALRLLADLGGWMPLRQIAGILNAATIVLFLGIAAGSAATGSARPPGTPSGPRP